MKYIFNQILLFTLCMALIGFTACNGDEGPDVPDLDNDLIGPEGSIIPYFVISTGTNEIVDEPKVVGNMAIFVEQQSVFQNPIGVELRGSTSQRLFDKKSYGVETWDSDGEDVSIEILDFAREEDWILQGPYSDKTFLRNVLIYDISNEIGMYAVQTQFAELVVNSDYKGLYVFMEKIKRDQARVDILKLEIGQTDESVISGGYILKIDKTSGDTNNPDWPGDFAYTENLGFRSDYGVNGNSLNYDPYGDKRGEETYFLYEYPDEDEINSAQKEYIQNYIKDFETALVNEDFSGSERDYENYIDVASFVDFFILNEISANPDAYRLSTFLHKDRGEKLKMGPIWDFNIAFGNDGRSNPQGWIYEYNTFYPSDLWLVPFWWEKLLEDPQFRAAIQTRWNELRGNELSYSSVETKIDAWIAELDSNGAIDRNYDRWPVIGEALPFNSFVGDTFEDEVQYLKDWYNSRLNWMDTQISSW